MYCVLYIHTYSSCRSFDKCCDKVSLNAQTIHISIRMCVNDCAINSLITYMIVQTDGFLYQMMNWISWVHYEI